MDFMAILAGVGAGITYGVTQYWKKSEEQYFEWKKLITTIVIGAGTGLVASLMNLDMENAAQYLIGLGVSVPVVENVLMIIWRKVIKKIIGKEE